MRCTTKRILFPLIATLIAFFASPAMSKTPVILDTDIGTDIDDAWALAFLLKCPELDLKLVVTDSGDTTYRAKLVARLLQAARRTDVAIGIGTPTKRPGGLESWVKDYDLSSYPGRVHKDGVQALVDTIMGSSETMTLLCIGPVPNIREALRREPRIATRARFVGMFGSIYRGYDNKPEICPEYNVECDPAACQAAFTAPWEMTITPLDTCGTVRLEGDLYQRVKQSSDPLLQEVMNSYRVWLTDKNAADWEKRSSILFDTVAVYLAFSTELCTMEQLNIRVTDDGKTVIDPKAKKVNCATQWKNQEAFKELLVNRLLTSIEATSQTKWLTQPWGEMGVVRLATAPYPDESRMNGFTSKRGSFPYEGHYDDNTVVFAIPQGFKAGDKVDVIVHFHGHNNEAQKALAHYRLGEQLHDSGRNAIVIVPQGGKNVPDEDIGKFEKPEGFKRFMAEALDTLRREGKIPAGATLGSLILSGHSGGYWPIAKVLDKGGLTPSMREVWLFDAAYGGLNEISAPFADPKSPARLRSIFTDHLTTKNLQIRENLSKCGRSFCVVEEDQLSSAAKQLSGEGAQANGADTPGEALESLLRSQPILFMHSQLAHDAVVMQNRYFEKFARQSPFLKEIAK